MIRNLSDSCRRKRSKYVPIRDSQVNKLIQELIALAPAHIFFLAVGTGSLSLEALIASNLWDFSHREGCNFAKNAYIDGKQMRV